MKKVLLVSCDGLGNGGVQAVIMGIVRKLHNDYKFDILLFTNEERYYDKEFLSYGGVIYRVPRYEGDNKFRKKIDYYVRGKHVHDSVWKLLKEHGPYDIIHCHDEFENAPILKAASEAGVPIRIAHTHIINHKSNFVANMLESNRRKAIQKYATAKVGCSRESCVAYYSVPDQSIIVNNAYDEQKFNQRNYITKEKNDFNIVQIGSYNPTKNQIFSVNVIKEILKKRNDVKLYLVGFRMGNYVDRIVKVIKENGLEQSVIFLPGDSDTQKLLSQSSYLIMPSKREGFGIVLIEAQAMGVSCFASDCIPRTTNCGGVKFLSLSAGASAWADAIVDDYVKTNGAHQKYDVSNYSTENIMKTYRTLYEGRMV